MDMYRDDVAAPVPKQPKLQPAGLGPSSFLPARPQQPEAAAWTGPLFRRDVDASHEAAKDAKDRLRGTSTRTGPGGWRKEAPAARGTHGGTEAGPRRRRAHGAEGRRGAAKAGPRRRRARGTEGRGAAEMASTRSGPTLPRPPPPRRASPPLRPMRTRGDRDSYRPW